MASRMQQLKTGVRRHRNTGLVIFSLLALPAIAAQLLASRDTAEAYSDLTHPADPVIVALLHGERLVAPTPLPPELFITREIESERQGIASASREWIKLDNDFRQRLLAIYQLMAKHGYHMVLLEGYRSPERQAALAQIGRHVTNAGAYQSYHQYGLAADSAFYRDGKIVISAGDPWAMAGYTLYGRYAESVGLIWGGNWKMRDLGHVELRRPEALAAQSKN